MATISEAKLAANRENAKKSTGPKSDEGKERSRANSWKHGLTGDGVVTSEALKNDVQVRVEEWNDALKPGTGPERWLVERAAVDSIRVDSAVACERARRAARLREDRLQTRDEGQDKVRVIASVGRQLGKKDADDVAIVRKLRSTSVGCDWLIGRWEAIARKQEAQGGGWGPAELRVAQNLISEWSCAGDLSRRLAALVVDYLTGEEDGWKPYNPADYAKKWTYNEELMHDLQYSSWTREDFLSPDDLPGSPGARERAQDRLRAFVAERIAELRTRRDDVAEAEALDAAEAADLLTVDLSEEGALLTRYENELFRRVQQSLREFHRLQDSRADDPAPVAAPPASPVSRNEPTASSVLPPPPPLPSPFRDGGASSNRPMSVQTPLVAPHIRE